MSVSNLSLVLLVSAVTFTAACSGGTGDASLGSTRAPVMAGGACASSIDCAAGLECESEVEHGVTTSVCKAHAGDDGASGGEDGSSSSSKGGASGSADDDAGATASTGPCPAGTEPELEHGVQTCKPHASADAGTVTSAGSTPAGGACASSADCALGLECEVQVEDGGTTSTCQPHGGKGKGN